MGPYDRYKLTFSKTILIVRWFSVSQSVNHISGHDFKCLFGIRTLNWQVRMYCVVYIRICVISYMLCAVLILITWTPEQKFKFEIQIFSRTVAKVFFNIFHMVSLVFFCFEVEPLVEKFWLPWFLPIFGQVWGFRVFSKISSPTKDSEKFADKLISFESLQVIWFFFLKNHFLKSSCL